MNFSAPFIRRPVATMLLTAAVLLLGMIAWYRLPIASLPTVDRPTISVRTSWPGASAEDVASAVTSPLETQLGLISGLKEMASSSISGQSAITMEFGLNKDLTAASGAVQAAINAAAPALPKNLPAPPGYVKANPSGFPIIALALTSDVYDIPRLYDYADTVVAAKLSQIQGVAKVFLSGATRPAVRIQANPRMLADMNLSMAALRGAIVKSMADLPKGEISEANRSLTIAVNDQLYTAADFKNVIVDYKNGAPIKLRDVANIFDDSVNYLREGWFDGKRAIIIYVLKEVDANVVQTVDDVLKALEQVDRWMPPAVNVHVVYNRTQLIRAELADVELTMAGAVILVVLVIALFLRRFWATVIPSVTIPVSIAATLGAMYLLQFSLDNLSLMALTIAVGFVIDDAVIIIENIIRLIESGETPIEAALKGTRQVGFTVISVTIALIAALIPILFMPDIVGRLFREFGLTLVIAILASAVVSLTLTPMLCGQLLVRSGTQPAGWLSRACRFIVERAGELYGKSLDRVLRFRWLTLAFAALLTAASVGLYLYIPKGFLPTQDTSLLRIRTVGKSNISFDAMSEAQQAVAAVIGADPAVAHLASFIGRGLMSSGTMLVSLKPPGERNEPIDQVTSRIRKKLLRVDGVRTFITPVQDVSVGARRTAARYQYNLRALDPAALFKWARIMRQKIENLPQVNDVMWNYEGAGLETGLLVNRARAARPGISVVDIDEILYDWFGQRPIDTIRFPINYSRVVLEVEPRFREDSTDLYNVLLTQGVPVEVMSGRKRRHAPMWTNHDNQLPGITIGFNTPLGVSIGQAETAIHAAEIEANLPGEIKASFKGEAFEAQQNIRTQPLLFLAAAIAVYIILGMLYESYAHPFTILSTLPSAMFGALAALALTHTQFSIVTAIACILLVGIVMKNAIMMVDFALQAERQAGLSATQAIRQAARLRFRPIVMTTLAALLAAVPLALSTGEGSELRQPLGIAIVGGLFLSQFVTLYTTPVIYLAIDALRVRLARRAPDAGVATA